MSRRENQKEELKYRMIVTAIVAIYIILLSTVGFVKSFSIVAAIVILVVAFITFILSYLQRGLKETCEDIWFYGSTIIETIGKHFNRMVELYKELKK